MAVTANKQHSVPNCKVQSKPHFPGRAAQRMVAHLAGGRLAGSFRGKIKSKEARVGAGRRQALEKAQGRAGSLESKVSKI